MRARTQALDVFDVLGAMSGHLHEHHTEMLGWSWKVFCVQWARTMVAGVRERERKRDEDAKKSDLAERQQLAAQHARRMQARAAQQAE